MRPSQGELIHPLEQEIWSWQHVRITRRGFLKSSCPATPEILVPSCGEAQAQSFKPFLGDAGVFLVGELGGA